MTVIRLCENDVSGPDRTFEQSAANDWSEPTPDVLILCCVRSQRECCYNGVNSYAAVPRENRSFL